MLRFTIFSQVCIYSPKRVKMSKIMSIKILHNSLQVYHFPKLCRSEVSKIENKIICQIPTVLTLWFNIPTYTIPLRQVDEQEY